MFDPESENSTEWFPLPAGGGWGEGEIQPETTDKKKGQLFVTVTLY
jgi:hypothetical protein